MLREAVASYLALRRATGFTYKRAGDLLLNFADFASERGDSFVKEKTALDWAGSSSSPRENDRRLRTVACFARHVRAEDPRHEIPPADRFAQPARNRPVPYIFAPEVIRRLVAQAQRLEPRGSLRPLSHSTLLALLASTGLRISEALALRMKDFSQDGLLVRQTKFRKTRLVPLHETTLAALERYRRRRALLCTSDDDHLFVGLGGKKLTYWTVYKIFQQLVAAVGLPHCGESLPHLHSFRHTFAVRALERCPNERDAVGRHLIALSTYLGHASFIETYWYLEATPQLLRDISGACEGFRKAVAG